MSRPVTTASRAAMTRTVEVPELHMPMMKPREVQAGEDLARYVTNQGRDAQFKIVGIDGDQDDMALTSVVLSLHPTGVIKFKNYHFSTPHASVALWLDRRIAHGILRGIMRDSIDMRLRCEYCDHMELNTPDGREKLNRHRVDKHGDLIYGAIPFVIPGELTESEVASLDDLDALEEALEIADAG